MADYAPVYGRPKTMTFTAGAALTGGTVVVISAPDTVSPAGVNGAPVGVAAHDAASGAPVTVFMGSGIVHETPAGAAVATAGVPLYAGATGQVTPTAGTGPVVGYAIRTQSTVGNNVRWRSVY